MGSSGVDSVPGSLGEEALSHLVQGTPQDSGSDSAGQAPRGHPVPTAKDPVWNGMAPVRHSRNMKQMPVERPSRSRTRRNCSQPLPSASDTVRTEGFGVQPSTHCRFSGSPRQSNWGTQGPQQASLDKDAWSPRSPTTYTGSLRRCWDKAVGRGYDWSHQGSCSATRPSLRRRSLGDSSAGGGWQESPLPGLDGKARSIPRRQAWADI